MSTAKAQAAQLLIARAPTPGTQPTTDWRTLQPNPSGIQNFIAQLVSVRRNPLNPYMTDEKGDHVGLDVNATLVHDLNKNWLDIFGVGLLRSLAKFPGNITNTQVHYPTAVTATGYTVGANGALANKLLVYARGFANSANNGLKLLAGTSTGTEIKTTGLVAETVTQGTASIEVAGVEAGAAAEIQLNASGHLTSSTTDFTTLNLKVGHRIWFKLGTGVNEFGIVSGTAGLHYATVAVTPTTNLIQLKWHSFTPGADAATGKTIRLYFGTMYRNVADGDADYIEEPAWWAELRDTGVGTAGSAVVEYMKDLVLGNVSIAMPTQGKVEATLTLMARDYTAPVDIASRLTGPSTAYPSIAGELFDTSTDMLVHRVIDDTNATIIASVMSATLTIDHGVTARKQHTTFGAAGMIFGNIRPAVELETYYESKAVPNAIRGNTTCRYEALWRNGQGGVMFDLPSITLRNGAKTYAENSPVMMAIGAPAHRDTSNVVMIVNVPPYLPT